MIRLCFWLPAVVWAGVIFVLSSLPPVLPEPKEPIGFVPLDKWAHLAAYGLLAGLVILALRRGHNLRLPATAGLAIVLTVAYGASDEWHQSFVPNRWATMGDWLADAIGAMLMTGIWYLYESIRRRKTNR